MNTKEQLADRIRLAAAAFWNELYVANSRQKPDDVLPSSDISVDITDDGAQVHFFEQADKPKGKPTKKKVIDES